jgi:hypothetical protein
VAAVGVRPSGNQSRQTLFGFGKSFQSRTKKGTASRPSFLLIS